MAVINGSFDQANDNILQTVSKSFSYSAKMGISTDFTAGTMPLEDYTKYDDFVVLGLLPKNCIITRCYILMDEDFAVSDSLEVGILATYPGIVEDIWESGIDLTVGNSMRNVALVNGTKQNGDSNIDELDPYKGAGKWVNGHPIYVKVSGAGAGSLIPIGSFRVVVEAVSYYPKG